VDELYRKLKNKLYCLSVIDKNTAYAAGRGIYQFDGLKWIKFDTLPEINYNIIKFFDNKNGFVTGDKGKILKMENGIWHPINDLDETIWRFTDASFPDTSIGYAIENKSIYKYKNGKIKLFWIADKMEELTSVFAFDENNVLVCDKEGKLLEYNGINWNLSKKLIGRRVYKIHFFDSVNGYAYSNWHNNIYYHNNSGWWKDTVRFKLMTAYMLKNQQFWAGSTYGGIYKHGSLKKGAIPEIDQPVFINATDSSIVLKIRVKSNDYQCFISTRFKESYKSEWQVKGVRTILKNDSIIDEFVEICGLKPYTEYKIIVACESGIGKHESNPISFKTKPVFPVIRFDTAYQISWYPFFAIFEAKVNYFLDDYDKCYEYLYLGFDSLLNYRRDSSYAGITWTDDTIISFHFRPDSTAKYYFKIGIRNSVGSAFTELDSVFLERVSIQEDKFHQSLNVSYLNGCLLFSGIPNEIMADISIWSIDGKKIYSEENCKLNNNYQLSFNSKLWHNRQNWC